MALAEIKCGHRVCLVVQHTSGVRGGIRIAAEVSAAEVGAHLNIRYDPKNTL